MDEPSPLEEAGAIALASMEIVSDLMWLHNGADKLAEEMKRRGVRLSAETIRRYARGETWMNVWQYEQFKLYYRACSLRKKPDDQYCSDSLTLD